jgi:hypothetical protein
MPKFFSNVNAKTTRTSDVIIDGAELLGPLFNGYSLNFKINSDLNGTIDLGIRNLIYKNISSWGLENGTYIIQANPSVWEAFGIGAGVNTTITGGSGGDLFNISDPGKSKSLVVITDFDYKTDVLWLSSGSTFYDQSVTLENANKVQNSAQVTHAGTGSDARTKVIIYNATKTNYSQLIIPGHLEIDGIELGTPPLGTDYFQCFFKPAVNLNLGDIDPISSSINISNQGSNNLLPSSTAAASYEIIASAPNVSEGSNAFFQISSSGATAGTGVPYSISGVSVSDIVGGLLTGTAILDTSGKATISIGLSSDSSTEGTETLTVTAGVKTASTLINDTSIGAPVTTTYTLVANSFTVSEGSTAKLTLTGINATKGTVIPYVISGIAAEDLTSGEVSGRVTLDDLGMGTISIPIAADMSTEGSEAMIISVGGQVATISINDTSKSGSEFYVSASDGLVEEGRVATFTVSAANAVAGTKLAYTLSGSGINAKDITNGKLSGSVSVGSDSSAIITVAIKADAVTEGDEELTLTITGKGVSETITIEDTSTEVAVAATYSLSAVESSVDEGSDAEFLIETDSSQAGKQFKWTITGVSAADVVGKKLSGTVAIDDDGTATISIPTATDALTEGNETLTLTVNGQKATVAVLDNNTVTIASVLLESDSSGSSALYKLSDGTMVIAEAGLYDGDTLEDYVPLKASPSTNYAAPKTVAALISYNDGGYGLLSKTGAVYSEQKFSDDGIAKGKATKLTAAQVLSQETIAQVDINGDGVIGEVITTVYDDNGDVNQQDYGLYKTSSGTIVLAASELGEDDSVGAGVTLMASKTKGWTIPAGSSIEGIALTDGGSIEVLTLKGKQYSAQKFNPETGLIKGKAIVLKTAQVDAREYYYDLDLTGDDEISIVGQETMPIGWIA